MFNGNVQRPIVFKMLNEKLPKLVRDKIPEIIRSDGENPITRNVEGEELKEFLIKKLYEEVEEYEQSKDPKELHDILEVIHALADTHDISKEELETNREQKSINRGSFSKGIVLEGANPK